MLILDLSSSVLFSLVACLSASASFVNPSYPPSISGLSPSLNSCSLATNLANLVLANIASPKPSLPTTVPSFLLASGLKLKTRSFISSKVLSPSALLVCLDLT